jgi:hypothetical protein
LQECAESMRELLLGQVVVGGHAREPVGCEPDVHGEDEPAPLLTEQGDVGEAELVQQVTGPGDVRLVGVRGPLDRLVRTAEPDQIGNQHPTTGRQQPGNHLAAQVAPARHAVSQHHNRPVGRPFVDVVQAQALTDPSRIEARTAS